MNMKCNKNTLLILIVVTIFKTVSSNAVSETDSLVISTTETTKESGSGSSHDHEQINPKITSMEIQTNISNRFATTLITSKVKNFLNKSEETTFSVVLPDNAFISEFVMEIDGKAYKAYVKEKKEAKRIYDEAVASGRSAGHVEVSARNSKQFTVSVNVEPESKTIFRLTYEELLNRQHGQYELIVNIHPGQIVKDLSVNVHINESRPLTFVKTPSLRTGNEISKNNDELNPSADIKIINATSAIVKFHPTKNQQKQFAQLLGSKKEDGLAGQFVVQYDVERDPQGGEVLVRDGYFVHFFSPSELEPLQKHVVFVLDHSGSMWGRKIEQLTEAMQNILSELNVNDLFHIVRFSESASVWNIADNNFTSAYLPDPDYGHMDPHLRELSLPGAVQATKNNTEKAKEIVKDHSNMGSTNIMAGLEVGLFLIRRTQEQFPKKYQPMIIFLTDGFPNVGMSSGDQITKTVTILNNFGEIRASIFSLSFGYGADKKFLQKLSADNLGFSRHIFEASDASLQLEDFYQTISSPLLANVTFKYVDGVSDVTKKFYPILFNGSELVVAGKTSDPSNIALHVGGICNTGPIQFKPTREEPVSSLERLWAYLTVKQLLQEIETETNNTELTKKALDLALKYSFVTSVSSLVVVKPNDTESVGNENERAKGDSHFRSSPGITPYYSSPNSAKMAKGWSARSSVVLPQSLYRAASLPAPSYNSYSARGLPGMPWSRPLSYDASRLYGPAMLPPRPAPYYPSFHRPLYTTTFRPRNNNSTPKWLQDLHNNHENITTSQGTFKIGTSGDVTTRPDCPRTPLNGAGECTLLFDCPQVFSALTDMNVYLQYFCPLNEFAGVCCPKTATTTPDLPIP